MESMRPKRALLSVYYKEKLEPLARQLHRLGVELISTGGTGQQLESWGLPWTAVEKLTGFPEVFGGRVKTLHPVVFGGILQRRDHPQDQTDAQRHHLAPIDLVVVELYPFAETVEQGGAEQEIIEKIDIGGVSLIRAAAKNFSDVLVLSSTQDVEELTAHLEENKGNSSLAFRRSMAARAFQCAAAYDAQIEAWFATGRVLSHRLERQDWQSLRYGENPHQKAYWKGRPADWYEVLSGKALSFNNLLDLEAGLDLLSDTGPRAVMVLKHNVACGFSQAPNDLEAWKEALSGDPVSAFGGVIISGRKVTKAMAEAMNKVFFELLAAPDFEEEALEILKEKKQRILLRLTQQAAFPAWKQKQLLGGELWQERDQGIPEDRLVSGRPLSQEQANDLALARLLVKHARSNAIVLVKSQKLIGTGSGHVSRVDAARFALQKAKEFGHELKGAVMASDAFFPFPDCVDLAAEEGISCIWQPGGSVRDQASIEAAETHKISMVMGGIRHFRHG